VFLRVCSRFFITELIYSGLRKCSWALSPDAACELDVLGHDRHALGVDRAQVRVLEKRHEVRLRCLLQRHYGVRLEAQVRLDVLRHLAHQTLEGRLFDQKRSALLVLADLLERHRARPKAAAALLLDLGLGGKLHVVRHTTLGGGGLAGGLGREGLAGRLAAGGLARSLLRASHQFNATVAI